MNWPLTIFMATAVAVVIWCAFGVGKTTMRLWVINIFIESLENDPKIRTPEGMRVYETLWEKVRALR